MPVMGMGMGMGMGVGVGIVRAVSCSSLSTWGDFVAAPGPSRRTVLASAWVAPVIVAAAAAPSAAASAAGPAITLELQQILELVLVTVTTTNAEGVGVPARFDLDYSSDSNTWTFYSSASTNAQGSLQFWAGNRGASYFRVTAVIDGIAVVAIAPLLPPVSAAVGRTGLEPVTDGL